MRGRITFSALAALLLITAAALSAPKDKPKRTEVSIKDRKYSPAKVNIKIGETVLWTNHDHMDHTVDAKDGSFSSGTIKSGKTYEFTFKKAGEYPYECTLHPRMKGSVVVAK